MGRFLRMAFANLMTEGMYSKNRRNLFQYDQHDVPKLDTDLLMSESEFVTEMQDLCDIESYGLDNDLFQPLSKYDEYEMRPIKPLDSHVQLQLYGSSSSSSAQFPLKSKPQPLKKYSGVTSKHAVAASHKKRKMVEGQQVKSSMHFPSDLRHTMAATKIQAAWRGFATRSKNPKVLEIRHELRCRRSEQYIRLLCHELHVLKEKYETEKQTRDVQNKAIRFMWNKVQMLLKNCDNEKNDPDYSKGDELQNVSSRNYPQTNLAEKKVSEKQDGDAAILKVTVQHLQSQVSELQNALQCFSNRLYASEDCEQNPLVLIELNDSLENDVDAIPNENGDSAENVESQYMDVNPVIDSGNMPQISLHKALTTLESPMTEKELWSLCEQSCLTIKARNNPVEYLSTDILCIGRDGKVLFKDVTDSEHMDSTFLAPELEVGQTATKKSALFSLSVTLWSAADYEMKEDEAPSLSEKFESLLVAMSHDDVSKRSTVEEVLLECEQFHRESQTNSLQICSSLYVEATSCSKSKLQQIRKQLPPIKSNESISTIKSHFKTNLLPEISGSKFSLKPVQERKLRPKDVEQTPHEKLMKEIKGGLLLKKSPGPKMFSVKDMLCKDPSLILNLNILPGQRQRNIKALNLAFKRQNPFDPSSAPRCGIPTAPQMLRAELKQLDQPSKKSSVVLHWHPSHIFGKRGKISHDSFANDIVGYRIYVNGQAKGMVTGSKSRALLDGLHSSCEYRIHVRAVSALGESDPSNEAIAFVPGDETATELSYSYKNKSSTIQNFEQEKAGCVNSTVASLGEIKFDIQDNHAKQFESEHNGTAVDNLQPQNATSVSTNASEFAVNNSEEITLLRSKVLLDHLRNQLLL